MKRVKWWIAKIYYNKKTHKSTIDIWDQFSSKSEATRYVKKDGTDSPFTVLKVTLETLPHRGHK
jgi:hypothetical protein